jgi:2-methylisocitrate lyase-like PEP mutase family enzyme
MVPSLPVPAAVERFRALHASGCFVIPNPWDVGSARLLHQVGFVALATSSAGLAFTRGAPDTVTALPRDATLAHVAEVARATPLPVNADFQNGYAEEPDGVFTNVVACVRTGAAGLSIEDATGDARAPLYERKEAIRRLAAARAAVDASGIPVVLTARCEAYLMAGADPAARAEARAIALDRLVAYAEAGADCLFAPGVCHLAEIEALVKAVHPKPLNVLVGGPSADLTVPRLAALGVRRISVGSALARVAWGAFLAAAKSIHATGAFDALGMAAPIEELSRIFATYADEPEDAR